MSLTSFVQQCWSVTTYNLQTIWRRRSSSLVAIFGVAGVVGVLVAVLSIAAGFRQVVTGQAREDIAVVMRDGATGESVSILSREDVQVIETAPGVARGAEGPLVSAEVSVIIDRPKKGVGTDANVPLRGVNAAAFEVRDQIEIVGGRMLEWGRNEVIVGVGAAANFEGLEVGEIMEVGADRWEVVGHFSDGGGISESEIWTDARALQTSYRRGNSFNVAFVRLTDPDALDGFAGALEEDPRVNLMTRRETTYYARQAEATELFITILGQLIVAMMAVGAVFALLNTMYAAISSRTREIATLRALGFARLPVIVSVLAESLAFAFLGAVLGGGASWLLFDGFQAATMNFMSFSQVSFAFDVTPGLALQGILLALFIGGVGGLLPAVAAARRSLVGALREQ